MKKIILTIASIGALLAGCTSLDPKIFLGDNTCVAPCWYGLFPGKTVIAESKEILKSLPFVAVDSAQLDANSINWRFTNQLTGYGTARFSAKGLLEALTIRTMGLHLGEAIDRMGPPETVWANHEPGENYVLHLYYPSKGLVIETTAKPNYDSSNSERISRDFEVYELVFFIPASVETYLRQYEGREENNIHYIADRLQSWPGFGEKVIRIEP